MRKKLPKKKTSGYIYALIAFTIFSFIGVILNTSKLTPNQNIFLFSTLAVIWLLLYLFLKKRLHEIHSIHITPLFIIFAISSGLYGVMFLVSQTIIPLSQAQFLFSTVPIFALLIEKFFYRHALTRTHIIAMVFGLLGILILLLSEGKLETTTILSVGSLMALSAAFLAAMQGFLLKKLENVYSLEIMIMVILISQAVVSSLFSFQTPWHFDTYSILTTVGLSFFNGIIAFHFYTSAIHTLRVSTVRILGYIEPFLGSIWGYLFLAQQIYPATVLGGICVLLAAYCIIKARE